MNGNAIHQSVRAWTIIVPIMLKPRFLLRFIAISFFVLAHALALQAQGVDFAHEIVPILRGHCIECHSAVNKKGGFSINTREDLLKGGESGAAIVPGKSKISSMIERIESIETDFRMPPDGDRLSEMQKNLLRDWIDQGAAWQSGFAFKTPVYEPPLKPRRPSLPASRDERDHPIDRLLDDYFEKQAVVRPQSISDETFLRRIFLDLVGLLPTPQHFADFASDTSSDKRAKWIDKLLSDDVAYAEHWLSFWNDLLRNDYGGTGFITNGRTQISRWLYTSLLYNKPYDQMARELISPTQESAGFSNGIRWRGTVSAGQTVEIQFAQSVGQSFLGINLKCASCHDSFIDRWKLEDAYGLASIFATGKLEIHRCDKPIGRQASPSWLFPELGQVDGQASQPERLKQLAELMTHPENGRFTRTIVNRFWQRLMGYGIVHPVDAMQSEPWNEDLLDYLAVDLLDNSYNLKHTLSRICNSKAYQSASEIVDDASQHHPHRYRGPRAKRMTAEQFVDAVWQLTDTAPKSYDAPIFRGKPTSEYQQSGVLKANWIWSDANASSAVPNGESRAFRKSFTLNETPLRSGAVATCNNSCTVYINGAKVYSSDDWEKIDGIQLAGRLKKGKNEILIVASNRGESPNPAGCFFESRMLYEDGRIDSIATDDTWQFTTQVPNKNGKFKNEPDDWKPAQVVGNQSIWKRIEQDALRMLTFVTQDQPMVRAALLKSDFLQRTLGRPNRDQIVTMRPNDLSTLEAIDLNTSGILYEMLRKGATHILQKQGTSREKIVDWVTRSALTRQPTQSELDLTAQCLPSSLSRDDVQDYLWAVMMTPEFQFIR